MSDRVSARNILAIAILIVAGALAFVIFRNVRGPGPEELLEALPANVDLALKQINYTETRDGIRRWTLVADSAAHNVGEGITRIENIHLTFYDEKNGDFVLSARNGTVEIESRQVELHSDVVATSPQGYALYTDVLHYRESDRLLRTDAPVRLVAKGMELTGKGMRLDVEKRTLQLLSDVAGRIEGKGTR